MLLPFKKSDPEPPEPTVKGGRLDLAAGRAVCLGRGRPPADPSTSARPIGPAPRHSQPLASWPTRDGHPCRGDSKTHYEAEVLRLCDKERPRGHPTCAGGKPRGQPPEVLGRQSGPAAGRRSPRSHRSFRSPLSPRTPRPPRGHLGLAVLFTAALVLVGLVSCPADAGTV